MNKLLTAILSWLGVKNSAQPYEFRPKLRATRSLLLSLHEATLPNKRRGEPLAFVHTRFASESSMDLVLAVGMVVFPERAYVMGSAGANFDTRWSIEAANDAARSNAGLFLAHRHGGRGKPAFSSVDNETNRKVMAALSRGMATAPYGAIVLSDDSAAAVLSVNGQLVDIEVELIADGLGAFGGRYD